MYKCLDFVSPYEPRLVDYVSLFCVCVCVYLCVCVCVCVCVKEIIGIKAIIRITVLNAKIEEFRFRNKLPRC